MRAAIVAFLALAAQVRASTFDLSSLPWTLRNHNGSIVVPGKVPSQAHLDLYAAGVITDPILGINDYTQRWVANDTWTYTADVTMFNELKARQSGTKTLLVFYGLDTVANITLCGHPVAWVNNQFRQFVFDVSDIIASPVKGNTNLTVVFEPAYAYGLNVSARPDIQPGKPLPETSINFVYPGARQYIRKTQSDFGWDWGPAFLPVGIYKPAHFITLATDDQNLTIEPIPSASPMDASIDQVVMTQASGIKQNDNIINTAVFIEETSVDIYKVGQHQAVTPDEEADWIVNVTLAIRSAKSFSNPTITHSIHELGISSEQTLVGSIQSTTDDVTWISTQWTIPDNIPLRWYPHDMATGPRLYDLTTTLFLDGSPVIITTRTGFRTVQLLQGKYTDEHIESGITPGDRFSFKINGIEFYSKGTNVIPMDSFYSRVNPDKVRWLLESAVKGGQNLLRIWGGGIYQPSDSETAGGLYNFHSLCDELGIMVWPELIFSDTLYQTNDFLVENFDYEVRSQVRRINRHPSVVHWAAGNEVEVILLLASFDPKVGKKRIMPFLEPFLDLFEGILYNLVTSETRAIPYSPCSFTRGVKSLDPYEIRVFDQLDKDNLYRELYGTFENYDYDPSQSFNLSKYPSSRYMVEFGINSMPSIYSWEEALTSADDFTFDSQTVVSRQHRPPPGNLTWPNPRAPEGQEAMLKAISLWLPAIHKENSKDKFTQQCYSSQVYQAMYMASEISWYRLGAGKPEQNRGVVVWQLNDVWQAPSWASIEYSGRWKILQYEMARAFKPVVINPFYHPNNETLEVYVTSDAGQDAQGSAQLTWYDWHGKTLHSSVKQFTVSNFQNAPIFVGSGLSHIIPGGADVKDIWLHMNVTASYGDKTIQHERTFTIVSLADSHLVDPKIKVIRTQDLTFTLSAKAGVAPWTWIEHPANTIGYFVDPATGELLNGFYLIPGQDRTVKFVIDSATSSAVPKAEEFIVRSVWDNKD